MKQEYLKKKPSKNKKPKRKLSGNLGLVGLGVGVLFWVFESGVDAFIFDNGTFLYQLTKPDTNETWLRLVVLFLLTAFGVYANKVVGKLSESERRMREMLTSVQLATVMFDKDGTITYVNEYLLEMSGYSREEIMGGDWFNIFIPSEFREEIRGVHKKVLSGKLDLVGHYENEILTKSGERRTVAWSNMLFNYSAKGGIVGTISFGEDITERKQAEEILQTQQYYLEKAQEIGNIGTWEFDVVKGDIIWTDEVYRIFDMPIGTPIKYETFIDRVHPDDKERVNKEYEGALEGNPYDIEHRIIIEGQVKWIREKAELFFDDQGKVVRAVGVAQDVTERKRAEEEALSLAKFPSENPNPVLRVSGDGTVLYANHAAPVVLRSWGCEGSEKLPEKYQQIIEDVLLSLKPSSIESYCPCGKTFSMTFAPVPDASYINIYGLDITERKKAENELRNNEERFRVMYEKSPFGYQSLDVNGCFLDVNPAWLKLVGASYDEVIGRSFGDFMTESDRERFQEKFPNLKKTGSVRDAQFELIGKNGDHIIVELNGNAAYDEKGNFQHSYCVLRDVTENKKAKEREEQHQAELAHASRLSIMGQMTTELAHEINQPLCAIMGHAESSLRAVRSKDPKNFKLADKMETIVKQTERVGKIISRIRHFTAKNSGEHRGVSINETVIEVLEIVEHQAKRNGVRIELNLEGDIKPLQADQIQIEQVILNLIQNGIDAMQEVEKAERKLMIRTREVAGAVEVAIRDAGGGISSEYTGSVLEPFFTTKSKGLGVGLSISRSIIESYGGKLSFRDNSSNGVTFYFTIPVSSEINTVAYESV